MKTLLRTMLIALAIGLLSGLFCERAEAQGPITGNITFIGGVSLDDTNGSVDTATKVTAWHGGGTNDTPQVRSRDGTFATAGVMPNDSTSFLAPWSFNTPPGTVTNPLWSVDGFTFDLTTSHIVQQSGGFLSVTGTGGVSHSGFTTTPGTFNFTTQDPSADSQFSFSAATTVPESGTLALFAIGGLGLAGGKFLQRKVKGLGRSRRFFRVSGPLFLP
jgi:hypothetical protein